jgi:predicted phosphodiesterase
VTLWAFVSDVHGNRKGLAEAEARATAAGADHFVSLGDIVGRGDPEGCVAWVRDHASIAIVGNRDLDYLDRVSPPLQAVILGWGNEGHASDFVVSHGDPKLHRLLSSAAERYGFRRIEPFLAERDARLWLFGHTHRSRCWKLENGEVRALDPTLVTLQARGRYIVNVGTCGLPLPGRGGPAFVLYDDRASVIRSIPLTLGRREVPKPGAIISEAMTQVR